MTAYADTAACFRSSDAAAKRALRTVPHSWQRIARTKAERLALMRQIAAEMRADGRLPPLDLVDAFGAR